MVAHQGLQPRSSSNNTSDDFESFPALSWAQWDVTPSSHSMNDWKSSRNNSIDPMADSTDAYDESWIDDYPIRKDDTSLKPSDEDLIKFSRRSKSSRVETDVASSYSSSSESSSFETSTTLMEQYREILTGLDLAISLAENRIKSANVEEKVAAAKDAILCLERGRSIFLCWGCDVRIETGSLEAIQGTIFELVLRSKFKRTLDMLFEFEDMVAVHGSYEVMDEFKFSLERILEDIESLKALVNPIRMSQAVTSGRGPLDHMSKKIKQVAESKYSRGQAEGISSSRFAKPSFGRLQAWYNPVDRPTSQYSPPVPTSKKLDFEKLQEISKKTGPLSFRRYARYNSYPVLVEPIAVSAISGRKPYDPNVLAALSSRVDDLRWLYFNTGTFRDLLGWIEIPDESLPEMVIYSWILMLYPDQFQSDDIFDLNDLFVNGQDIGIDHRLEVAYEIAESVYRMHLVHCHHFDIRRGNVVFIPLSGRAHQSLGPPNLLGFGRKCLPDDAILATENLNQDYSKYQPYDPTFSRSTKLQCEWYGVGVVLIEIALWGPLEDKYMPILEHQDELLELVRLRTNSSYRFAVEKCLDVSGNKRLSRSILRDLRQAVVMGPERRLDDLGIQQKTDEFIFKQDKQRSIPTQRQSASQNPKIGGLEKKPLKQKAESYEKYPVAQEPHVPKVSQWIKEPLSTQNPLVDQNDRLNLKFSLGIKSLSDQSFSPSPKRGLESVFPLDEKHRVDQRHLVSGELGY